MDPLFDLPALLRALWERVPRRVWLALGLALVTLAVGLQSRGLGRTGVPVDLDKVGSVLVPPLYFLVAAALWIGVRMWRSGRRSADWAAALFSVTGLMELALLVISPDAAFDPFMLLRSLVSALALVGAGGLLAHGLWQGHRPTTATERLVLQGLGIPGVLAGSLMVAGNVFVATSHNVEPTAWTWPLIVLDSAWVPCLVAVIGSALVRGWRFRGAQVAVAIGALGLAIVRIGQSALRWFPQRDVATQAWALLAHGVLSTVSVVFLLLLVAGLLASAELEPAEIEATMDRSLPQTRLEGETAP
jgi:hypothetical protein